MDWIQLTQERQVETR